MLILCPECGIKVSHRALTCPPCGYPITEFMKLRHEFEWLRTVARVSVPSNDELVNIDLDELTALALRMRSTQAALIARAAQTRLPRPSVVTVAGRDYLYTANNTYLVDVGVAQNEADRG
jgi:hypothetical protein